MAIRRLFLPAVAITLGACQSSPSIGIGPTTNANTTTVVVNAPSDKPAVLPPTIASLDYFPKAAVGKAELLTLTSVVNDPQGLPVNIRWTTTKGRLVTNSGMSVQWQPVRADGTIEEGDAVVTAIASNGVNASAGVVTIRIAGDGSAQLAAAPVLNVAPPPGSGPASQDPVAPGGGATLQPPARPTPAPVRVPGAIDREIGLPGGVPMTSDLGPSVVNGQTFSVQLAQGFVPSKDGELTAFAASISAAEASGGDTTVAIHRTDDLGMPVGDALGTSTIPGASIQPFGLNNPYTAAVFEPPVPVKAGQAYIAVLGCETAKIAWLLSSKAGEGGEMRISFAAVGNAHWLWNKLPENNGVSYGVHRTYLRD